MDQPEAPVPFDTLVEVVKIASSVHERLGVLLPAERSRLDELTNLSSMRGESSFAQRARKLEEAIMAASREHESRGPTLNALQQLGEVLDETKAHLGTRSTLAEV